MWEGFFAAARIDLAYLLCTVSPLDNDCCLQQAGGEARQFD
jgi:hypothetical protein